MNVSNMLSAAAVAGVCLVMPLALGWAGWALCKSKGWGVAGFVLGFLLGPIGLILGIALPTRPGFLTLGLPPICPNCYEQLAPGATRCEHCDGQQAVGPSGPSQL